MDPLAIVVFAFLSLALILCLGWFLYLLLNEPHLIWRANYRGAWRDMSWEERFHACLMVLAFIMASIALGQLAYDLLAWMPDSWGNSDDGAWTSTRKGVSYLLGPLAAMVLGCSLGRGIRARILSAQQTLEIRIREEIDRCLAARELEALRSKLVDIKSIGDDDGTRTAIEKLAGSKFDSLTGGSIRTIIHECIEVLDMQLDRLQRARDASKASGFGMV